MSSKAGGRRRSEGDTRSQRSSGSSRSKTSATSRQPLTAADGAAGAMVFRPPSEVGGPIGSIQENRAERDPKQWVNKLCGCSCGCSTCLFGCFCAPCAAARARSRFDGSAMCFNICFLNLCIARNYIRRGYGIKGHYCDDCWASICCGPCVACQLLGETEERGSVVERWALNPHRTVSEQPWKFGLCSCTEDLPNCAYGCCCWPCAVGSVRYALDGSDCLFNCCMLNAPMARSMVRKAYNIQGSAWGDCGLTCVFFPCVLCQLLNEVQHRGRIDQDARGILGGVVEINYMKR